jgi:pimeloyl-ACP methyl ester carboxylesterase
VHDVLLWKAFYAMGSELGPAVAVRQMQALLHYRGSTGNLGAIVCPTLLICGDEDQRTPVAVHEHMAKNIPGASMQVMRGAGHFTPLERPAEVNRALRQCLALAPGRNQS